MSYPHYSTDCTEYHGLVRDFGGVRPTIVTLCGSTRFKDEFTATNRDLTLRGYLVISVGLFGHSGDLPAQQCATDSSPVKIGLDQLHFRKIDLADEILVINPGGYIGASTRREIAYAERIGRPVRYLETASGEAATAV